MRGQGPCLTEADEVIMSIVAPDRASAVPGCSFSGDHAGRRPSSGAPRTVRPAARGGDS